MAYVRIYHNRPKADIKVMMIDPTELMADINKENNLYVVTGEKK